MSTKQLRDGDEQTIGALAGLVNPEWDDEGDVYEITANRDQIGGRRYHYLVAGWQDERGIGHSVRVDLDTDGWRALSALATTMAALVEEYQSR